MEKRVRNYLKYLKDLKIEEIPEEELKEIRSQIGQQIAFFQHERLIHLIVTVTFAILTVLSLFAALFLQELMCFILTLLLFVLLVPYIRHYYILENSVQKMYVYYDAAAAAINEKNFRG